MKDASFFNTFGKDFLPGLLGIQILEIQNTYVIGEMRIEPRLLAPNNFLHAGAVVSFADTLAGYGCVANLPENAHSFTTIELKSNFLSTVRQGFIWARAELIHGGKTTQVWDVEVKDSPDGKKLALFRCTQMILYPKP